MSLAVERLSCEVRQVDDAQLAIELLLADKTINVLILDWDLRGSSQALPTALGEDVLQNVIRRRIDLTVVVVTGALHDPDYQNWRQSLGIPLDEDFFRITEWYPLDLISKRDLESELDVGLPSLTARLQGRGLVEEVRRKMGLAKADSHAAPEGLVTIMFTDMEDFSAMTERLGDRKGREVLRTHNRILREELHRHGGFEQESAGDGFMLVFQSCRQAVSCAISLQNALAAQNAEHPETPIRVRCGLSAGEPLRKDDDGGYYGHTVIEAARISEQARGEQVLVSELVYTMLRPSGDFDFQEVGSFKLKGLTGVYKLYEVVR